MLTRRIIPCLDIRDGRVVKGIHFENLVDSGELCFLDVTASVEGRGLSNELVEAIAQVLAIPFTVGGGVRSVPEARGILRSGADKVPLNTAALLSPDLLTRLADEFGAQCVVISIDTRRDDQDWWVATHGGRRIIRKSCIEWAIEATQRGAGEILLNVIDADGTRGGFALDITREVADSVCTPVIASGGGGDPSHFVEVFRETGASAARAASIFHDDSWTPDALKKILRESDIEVRL